MPVLTISLKSSRRTRSQKGMLLGRKCFLRMQELMRKGVDLIRANCLMMKKSNVNKSQDKWHKESVDRNRRFIRMACPDCTVDKFYLSFNGMGCERRASSSHETII